MKKIGLFLAFMLSLFLVLFFSSCDEEKFPDPEKHPLIIEKIDQNYLVLKPQKLDLRSYQNPKNIFLEKNTEKGEVIGNWYKKEDDSYKLFSLRYKLRRDLDADLAYEIIDTVYVDQQIEKIEDEYYAMNKPMEVAYHEGLILIKKIKRKEQLSKYFWIKTNFLTQDSLLNYNPKTKSFFTSKTKIRSEVKTDLGPIILVLLFIIFNYAIIFRDKIKWLKEIREKMFASTFFDNIENDHQLNSLILFLLVFIFNSIYSLIWETDTYYLNLLLALILGLVARLIYWGDKLVKPNWTKVSSVLMISAVLAMELLVISASKVFGAISLALIILPAIIVFIIEIIKHYDYKKYQKTAEIVRKWKYRKYK